MQTLLASFLVAALVSQTIVLLAMAASFEDQKNYYPPTPHGGSPHRGSSHKTPSHGGVNCKTPTKKPTPQPSPSGGGGYYNPPSSGGSTTPTPTPTPVYHPPPTSGGTTTPTTPTPTPTTPTPTPTPTTPTPTPTPTTPIPTPTTPIPTPTVPTTPPFVPDPNTPIIGTCYFWKTHPAMIWALLGWWGSLGNAFGVPNLPGIGRPMSLPQALGNTRTDGYGALYREGTASFLNSLANNRFPLTTNQVKTSFITALGSNTAAAAQAQVFKVANEGKLKPKA